MQRQNGVIIKDHQLNDVKCAEMISSKNDSLKADMESEMINSMYYSIMIDAGTDISVKESEAMVVRYVYEGEPTIKLLGLVELEHRGLFKSG